MRRFKSAMNAEEEAKIKAAALGIPYVQQPRWDTTAITPGTQFMAKLAQALRAFQKKSPKKILVSPADVAGEGEQKIMEYIRTHKPASTVIYGLDADLIVLSLWATATLGVQVDLFREEVEFSGAIKEDALGVEQFLYLDIGHLAHVLHAEYGKSLDSQDAFIQEFVGLMNLLGNDFVPHGMGLKIRDAGVEKLLLLANNELRTHGTFVVQKEGKFTYNVPALKMLFRCLAAEEATSIAKAAKKKLEARVGATAAKEPEQIALAVYNDTPVKWAAEKCLVEQYIDPEFEKPQWRLKANWTENYDTAALYGVNPQDAAKVYLQALAWTLAYYAGEKVDMEWFYPWPLPPRAETISNLLEVQPTEELLKVNLSTKPELKPEQQLAMVLPESSFHLLPECYRSLPSKFPHAWPRQWGHHSLGRRFLWECEPLIPIITPQQIREWTA